MRIVLRARADTVTLTLLVSESRSQVRILLAGQNLILDTRLAGVAMFCIEILSDLERCARRISLSHQYESGWKVVGFR